MYLEVILLLCKVSSGENIKQHVDRLNISEKENLNSFSFTRIGILINTTHNHCIILGDREKETTEHSDANEVLMTHLWKKTIKHIDFYYE